MTPIIDPNQLRDVKPWEYVVRFAFGGAITVATGLIASRWGSVIAGLFLAFPAILPASLTLVKRHNGRARARDDARGGTLGSFGLMAFAIVVAASAGDLPAAIVLALAGVTWLAVNVVLWFLRFG